MNEADLLRNKLLTYGQQMTDCHHRESASDLIAVSSIDLVEGYEKNAAGVPNNIAFDESRLLR